MDDLYDLDESGQKKKKMSLLDKVNEIIKSCVKLKEEKKMTGPRLSKANAIIKKAKEKEKKLMERKRKRSIKHKESENVLPKEN